MLDNNDCNNCDCYMYCTRDTCILDIEDEKEVFEFTDREGIEY